MFLYILIFYDLVVVEVLRLFCTLLICVIHAFVLWNEIFKYTFSKTLVLLFLF